MSNLSLMEKKKLERVFGMSSGYVLNFSNRTFEEYIVESVGIEIYSKKYSDMPSDSKANYMRAFWKNESNYIVGKLLTDIFNDWSELKESNNPDTPPEECLKIALRLKESTPVPEIEAIQAISNEKDFEELAKSIRASIDKNEPENGLDRLHTFLVKYFRVKCQEMEINIDKKKPLHSLVGEYIKALKKNNLIESDMTERILKSSISVMESFSYVRNNQSHAHDNEVLNHNESLLIFGHVTNSVRFIERLKAAKIVKEVSNNISDDFPF